MLNRPQLVPLPKPRPRRPRVLSISVLPTLLTAGNALAGVVALSYLMDAWGAGPGEAREQYWVKAAWMVFVGMICDLLDGRVARLTKSESAFGAELDSLADAVTFGLTPALLSKSLIHEYFPSVHPKWATALIAIYTLGAVIRLARYNVESARAVHPGQVTRVFRGMPTPGAAGVIASLVLLRHEYGLHWLDWGFLVGAPVLGLLMVSRFPYSHVLNRWLSGRRSPLVVVLLLVVLFLASQHLEAVAATLFVGYALSGPFLFLTSVTLGRPRWAVDEEADEGDEESERDGDEPDGEASAGREGGEAV